MSHRPKLTSQVLATLLLVSGCQQDFGAFSFRESDGRDAGPKLHPDGGIGRQQRDSEGDPHADAAAPDGAPLDAGSDPASPIADAGARDARVGDADAQVTEIDAGAKDGGARDGGGDAGQDAAIDPAILESVCTPVFEGELPAEAPDCLSCGCSQCADVLLDCFDDGTPEGARCAAVLRCALENTCRDWDCYCASSPCGAPSLDGDGPCVAEMDAAANGNRAEVDAIRQAGTGSAPLVRAIRAIECTLGLHRRSPNGPLPGRCEASCAGL